MKSSVLCSFLWLVLIVPLWAQIPESERLTVQFRVEPSSASVYHAASPNNVRHSADDSEDSNDSVLAIGAASDKLIFDRRLYPDGNLLVVFRADGYQDEVRTFAIQNVLRNKIEQVTLPPEGQPPVSLVPKAREWASIAIVGATAFLCLGLLGAAYFRWKATRVKAVDIKRWVSENLVLSTEIDPLIGRKLGPYWLVEKLGHGGMATVYRAVREEETDAPLALKVIHQHVAEGQDFLGRFRREVLIGSNLIHPGIVELKDAGVEEGRHYIAMELVVGRDLRSHLSAEGLPWNQALPILSKVYEAVAHAHSQDVVHRDLKPENILLTEHGEVKLTDFGLAKSHNLTNLTATGSVLGTPSYMAPEQISGQPLNPATDQYALGVLTFEVLTGRLPFAGEDVMQILMAHLSPSPAPSLSSVKEGLPDGLDGLLSRMMEKDPKARFSSVAEALEELRTL